VLRSRRHGAIPPLPQYAFMAQCSVKTQIKIVVFYILIFIFLDRIIKDSEQTGSKHSSNLICCILMCSELNCSYRDIGS
jgi:hypothetical protein